MNRSLTGIALVALSSTLAGASAETPGGADLATGHLDWSAWERFMKIPPKVVETSRLGAAERKLLDKEVELIVALLTPPDTEAWEEELDQLLGQFPGPVTERRLVAIRERYVYAGPNRSVIRRSYFATYASATVQTSSELMRNYEKLLIHFSLDNVDSNAQSLRSKLRRDLKEQREAQSRRGGRRNLDSQRIAERKANIRWLEKYITPFVKDLEAFSAKIEKRRKGEEQKLAWKGFEANFLKRLQLAIEKGKKGAYPVAENGTFTIPAAAWKDALIYCVIGGRELYFPLSRPPGALVVTRVSG